MVKLTFYIDGQPVEFEGTVDEVAVFLKTVQREGIQLDMSEDVKRKREELAKERAVVEEVKRNLPSVDDVVDYILSQKDYRHSTFAIMDHFFGRTFKARGITEGLYHDFLKIATEARERIEDEQDGEFEYFLERGRHKIYSWSSSVKGG